MPKFVVAAATAIALTALSFGAATAAQHDLTEGEVTKVDVPAERITLRHGPIKPLDMDGMTMLFRVQDKAMLKAVKVGDKIKFRAERIGGGITLTYIEKRK
ncbi:MAG: copper-binding protein [Xanthobacteraceae bacterium]